MKFELSTICRKFNCNRLKMEAADGKKYLTDAADPEASLRIVQSVPSPKAGPIKLWLAKVGYERMQDKADPAHSVDSGLLRAHACSPHLMVAGLFHQEN